MQGKGGMIGQGIGGNMSMQQQHNNMQQQGGFRQQQNMQQQHNNLQQQQQQPSTTANSGVFSTASSQYSYFSLETVNSRYRKCCKNDDEATRI